MAFFLWLLQGMDIAVLEPLPLLLAQTHLRGVGLTNTTIFRIKELGKSNNTILDRVLKRYKRDCKVIYILFWVLSVAYLRVQ